jgi:DNA polymerase-3 subunit alpha
MGLFDMGESSGGAINLPPMPPITEWDDRQRLANEKESLGFYVSGHPLDRYEATIEKFSNTTAETIGELNDGAPARIGGLLSAIKVLRTKKGDLMAFVTISDLHGSVETVVFPEAYAKAADLLAEDSTVLIQGQIQKDENSTKIIADEVVDMDLAEDTWTAAVHIHLDADQTDRDMIVSLREVLEKHPGGCQTFLHLFRKEVSETVLKLSENFRSRAGSGLRRDVRALVGYSAVDTVCSPATTNGNGNGGFRKGAGG